MSEKIQEQWAQIQEQYAGLPHPLKSQIDDLRAQLAARDALIAGLRDALGEAMDLLLVLQGRGGRLSNCCHNAAQAGGFVDPAVEGATSNPDANRKRVTHVLRETVKAWDEAEGAVLGARGRLRAALAATPEQALEAVRRDERLSWPDAQDLAQCVACAVTSSAGDTEPAEPNHDDTILISHNDLWCIVNNSVENALREKGIARALPTERAEGGAG